MNFTLILNSIIDAFIDIILIFYYILKSISIWFIPLRLRSKSVENKIILITGGGSGIGRRLAIELCKKGAIIAIVDINRVGLEETAQIIESMNGTIFTFECDITDRRAVYEMGAQVRRQIGTVYMLINNAGIVSGKDLLKISDQMIIKTLNINALSHFWLIKAFLPDMMNNNCGHLVSIASIAGLVGVSGLTDYCASKFAAIG